MCNDASFAMIHPMFSTRMRSMPPLFPPKKEASTSDDVSVPSRSGLALLDNTFCYLMYVFACPDYQVNYGNSAWPNIRDTTIGRLWQIIENAVRWVKGVDKRTGDGYSISVGLSCVVTDRPRIQWSKLITEAAVPSTDNTSRVSWAVDVMQTEQEMLMGNETLHELFLDGPRH